MKKTVKGFIALLLSGALLFTGCASGTESASDTGGEDTVISQTDKESQTGDIASDAQGTTDASGNPSSALQETAQPDSSDSSLQDAGGMFPNEFVLKDVTYPVSGDDNYRVFYQIFVGSFSDSDGDGIGDLRGIINRMDYLNDGISDSGKSLGVEGIWLSPIFKSPSYHKYDATDYYEIDESFGTMDDLRELVKLCHQRDIKIILDLAINHTGNHNQWFLDFCSARRHSDTQSPYYDFYTVSDAPRNGNRTFTSISSTTEYYESNFSSDMPELNYDNEAVYKAVYDVAAYYLTEIGVDGFRFDAAKYIYLGEEKKNVEFWTRYMQDLRALKPDIYTVAEVWDVDSVIKSYASAVNCFDFTMAQTAGMISETTKRGDVNRYTHYVESFLNMIHEENPDAMMIPFMANHDTDRAAGYMTIASNYAKMAANLYILGPGSPFIYYGEEIGLKGMRGSENTDANRRLAMLWGDGDTVKDPVGSTFDSKKQTNGTAALQAADENSLYNHYKKLIHLRKLYPEIARGKYTAPVFGGTKLGGFISEYEGNTVGVFHNTTGSEITVDLSEVCDFSFSTVCAYVGVAAASLDGSMLTLGEQTSVILK